MWCCVGGGETRKTEKSCPQRGVSYFRSPAELSPVSRVRRQGQHFSAVTEGA